MGASASREESLFLPSIVSKPTSELQSAMEGGPELALLCRSKVITRCLGSLAEFESLLAQANALAPTLRSALGGLRLSFALKTGVTRRELLAVSFSRVFGSAVVIVRAETDLNVRGSPRVTTPRGFVWLHLALMEIASAVSLLKTKPPLGEHDECPICMDRPVAVVLACGHAFCKVCQLEWLVGEGRGTCPLCRSQESERNEWVFGDAEGEDVVVAHAEATVARVLRFLAHLPTTAAFAAAFQMPYGGAALWQNDDESPKDVLRGWLRAEMNSESGAPRCTRCDAAMRVPALAEGHSRLLCEACSAILSVSDLAPGNRSFFKSLGPGGAEHWKAAST